MDIYHKIERHDSGYLILEMNGDDSYHRRIMAYCTTSDNAILVRDGLDLLIMKQGGLLHVLQPSEEEYVSL